MRNKIITNQDFNKLINENISMLPLYIDKVETKNDDKSKQRLLYRIYDYLMEISIAHYSKGSEKYIVSDYVKKTVIAFENGFKYQSRPNGVYGAADHLLWTISLTLLCGLDSDYFNKIVKILKRDEINDTLINFIITSKVPEWNGKNGWIQESPYIRLQPIIDIEKEEEGILLIKNYLENIWYQEHADDELPSYWVDLHKKSKDLPRNSLNYHPDNVFFGYWAWETAAIVKIKGWNDESLKDVNYYPYDAVHW